MVSAPRRGADARGPRRSRLQRPDRRPGPRRARSGRPEAVRGRRGPLAGGPRRAPPGRPGDRQDERLPPVGLQPLRPHPQGLNLLAPARIWAGLTRLRPSSTRPPRRQPRPGPSAPRCCSVTPAASGPRQCARGTTARRRLGDEVNTRRVGRQNAAVDDGFRPGRANDRGQPPTRSGGRARTATARWPWSVPTRPSGSRGRNARGSGRRAILRGSNRAGDYRPPRAGRPPVAAAVAPRFGLPEGDLTRGRAARGAGKRAILRGSNRAGDNRPPRARHSPEHASTATVPPTDAPARRGSGHLRERQPQTAASIRDPRHLRARPAEAARTWVTHPHWAGAGAG